MQIAQHIQAILEELGEDPGRDGLKATPERVNRSLKDLTRGYNEDPREVIGGALFDSDSREMVTLCDIALFSMCEHHMLPFFGRCHIGYLPDKKIVGFSKLARVVDLFSRRFQVQERLTKQIADTFMEVLQPRGVAVVVEAYHMCIMMRGVSKEQCRAVTSSMSGEFESNASKRQEFMQLINRPSSL